MRLRLCLLQFLQFLRKTCIADSIDIYTRCKGFCFPAVPIHQGRRATPALAANPCSGIMAVLFALDRLLGNTGALATPLLVLVLLAFWRSFTTLVTAAHLSASATDNDFMEKQQYYYQ